MFRHLRTRLILTILALVALPVLVTGGVVTYLSSRAQERAAVDAQQLLVDQVSDQIDTYIRSREREMTLLVQVTRLASLSAEQQLSEIATLQSVEGAYEDITLVDASGRELARSSRLNVISQSDLESRSNDAAYIETRNTGETYFSPVSFNLATGEPFMVLAIPIEDIRTGDYQGSLIATVRFKPVWDLLDAYKIEDVQEVYVVDTQDRVVAHTNPSVVLSNTTFKVPGSSASTTGLESAQVVLTTKPVTFGSERFNVVVESPRKIALASSTQLVRLSVLILLVATLLAVGVGILVANEITQPIEELTRAAGRFALGDLSERIDLLSVDEIGTLGRAFNSMADELTKTLKSLEASVKEARAATAEAREASRAKDEFLSVMSHELRTPLNAILGYQGILELMGVLDGENLTMVQRSQANARRLLSLINDILDISRIEAGRMEIIPTDVPIRDFIQRIQDQMSVLADEKTLDFEVIVNGQVPSSILIDEDALNKIIVNLLGNAFKFTEEGKVSLYVSHKDDNILLAVRDTGVGIPSHMQQIIFERFRQVDSTSTRSHGGSGLGLSIVQQICNLLGGQVRVESEVGRGSTFFVTLPVSSNGTHLASSPHLVGEAAR